MYFLRHYRLEGEKKLIQLMFSTPSCLNDIPLDILKRVTKIILSIVLEKREPGLFLPLVPATEPVVGMFLNKFIHAWDGEVIFFHFICGLLQWLIQCKLNVDAAIN